MCAALVFFSSYAILAARVVDLSLFRDSGAQAILAAHDARLAKGKHTQKPADEISLLSLVREGITKDTLGMENYDTKPEPIAPRADIVDRNGVLLATSLKTASLYANPSEVRHPKEVAARVAEVLSGIKKKQMEKRLVSGKQFAWIKRNLSPREQQKVNNLGIPGLYFQDEYARSYPQGNLFSHVLGFVGVDNQGLAGIERHFNPKLQQAAKDAEPLALSMDMRVQHILRQELGKSVREFKALGATGVVLHVPTGEVRAMVSLPDFNPNKLDKARSSTLFNRATLGSYEMGSTFKTFTMAMGLDSGAVGMNGGYDASEPIKVDRFTIRDSHPRKYWLSVPEIYAYSSNVGTVKMAMEVGRKKQKHFLERLGFAEKLSLEIPELSAPVLPKNWGDVSMATISFGHGMSVSPMHLVKGISAMVNGGKVQQLTLIKDGAKEKAAPEPIISAKTSAQVRELMRTVVKYGTGSKAAVSGYQIGGKTGTAEKAVGGRYSKDAKLSSFVSAFPMDNPEYVIFAMLDEPQGTKQTYGYATGGWVAAPVIARVVEQMAPMLGMQAKFEAKEDSIDRRWARIKARDERRKARKARKKAPLVHAATYRVQ